MGKDHVRPCSTRSSRLDADGIGAGRPPTPRPGWPICPGIKISLVVVDDLMGGWTNRYAYEYDLRFRSGPSRAIRRPSAPLR